MIDPDIKAEIDKINENLIGIQKKGSTGIWRAFFNGMFSALGYVVGLALVVVILGWILQKTGLLQAFQDRVKDFGYIIDQAKKLTGAGPTPTPESSSDTGSGGYTTVTLPDGQQVQVKYK